MTRIVVLISGRGSNMQSIVKACESGAIDASVTAVISNRPDAPGLDFAKQHDIDAIVCDHTRFTHRDEFDAELGRRIESADPDWIVLAGFIRILGTELVSRYEGRMINIHPSLLPKYPGLNTHERALSAGDTEHGATVHFVTPELDAGPVISQVKVPILEGDDKETLAARVLEQEHRLLVEAVQRCVTGQTNYRAAVNH